MNDDQLFEALMGATSATGAREGLDEYLGSNTDFEWRPLGGRQNNSGTVEAATNAGRAIVERVTNAIDAVLEKEHHLHAGHPDCRSPRDADEAWLNVPHRGLSRL